MKLFKHDHTPSLAQILPDENEDSGRIIRHVVKIGCIVNACLMILKLSAGYFGHSDALFADGFHSLNDMAADLLMLVFVGISFRNADKKYSYGYGKFETLSSLLISSFLVIIAVMITIEAIESLAAFFNGELLPKPDIWTVVVVIFAMSCKEGLYRYYSHAGRKAGSKALLANAWHHRSDAMASVATLIGVTFAHFFGESFRVLDPVASLVIAVFIFFPALRLLRPAFFELMERALPEDEIQKVTGIVKNVPEVMKILWIRSRRVGHKYVFDIGVLMDGKITVAQTQTVKSEIKRRLEKSFCPHIILSLSCESIEPA